MKFRSRTSGLCFVCEETTSLVYEVAWAGKKRGPRHIYLCAQHAAADQAQKLRSRGVETATFYCDQAELRQKARQSVEQESFFDV